MRWVCARSKVQLQRAKRVICPNHTSTFLTSRQISSRLVQILFIYASLTNFGALSQYLVVSTLKVSEYNVFLLTHKKNKRTRIMSRISAKVFFMDVGQAGCVQWSDQAASLWFRCAPIGCATGGFGGLWSVNCKLVLDFFYTFQFRQLCLQPPWISSASPAGLGQLNGVAVRGTIAVLVHEHMLVRMRQHMYVWPDGFVPVCVLVWMDVKPTFLTVMFVLMQYKTVAALTNVRADRVDALVLAAAVVLAALIFVCERHTCNTSLMWKQCGRGPSKKEWH